LRAFAVAEGLRLYEISSVTGQGLERLKQAVWSMLEAAPRPVNLEAQPPPQLKCP
jgi:hypothetical protein